MADVTITVANDQVVTTPFGYDAVGAGVAMAAASAAAAQTARVAAENAQAGAQTAAASVPARNYASISAALADTGLAVDQLFSVGSGTAIQIYRRTGTTPFYVASYFDATTVGLTAGGTAGAVTVQSILSPDEALLKVSRRTVVGGLGGLHVFGIDSLTDGAGGYSYRPTYEAIMRANLGYGGPGWQAFGYGTSQDRGASFFRTGTFAEVSVQNASGTYKWIADYAPNGGCMVFYGTGYFTWGPEALWKTARVFYKVGPTMAAFTWQPSYTGFSGSPTLVDCYAASEGIAYFDYTVPVTTASGFRFDYSTAGTNASGPMCVIGADFVYDAAKFRPGNLAQGGRRLAQNVAQNAAAIQAWFAAVTPAVYICNAGMNDRATDNAATFTTNLNTHLANVQTPSPTTLIVLVQPLASGDTDTSYLTSYRAARVSVAQSRKCLLVDLTKELGSPNYTIANANGLMIGGADTIHPGQFGDLATARVYARALGASLALVDPGKTAFSGSGGTAVKIYTGNMTEKQGLALTAPVSAVTGATGTLATDGTLTVGVAPSSGSFAVGQMIAIGSAVGIITALGTGTGGTGTYTTTATGTVISSATAITGYTVTPVVLYNLGMGTNYNLCMVRLNIVASRSGTNAMRRSRIDFGISNTTVNNSAALYGTVQKTDDMLITAGDGQTVNFIVRVIANGNLAQVTLTPINYAGSCTVTGSYIFPYQNNASLGLIEN